jgi:hypothetical protein
LDLCQQKCPSKEFSLHLREHAGAARLNGLDLRLAPGQTTEAGRELGTVKEFTRRRADGAQGGSGLSADAGVEGSATERAVLLGLGPVGREGVRESTGGRGRVNARSVVHGLCEKLAGCTWTGSVGSLTRDGTLADEADQGSPGSVVQSESGTHCEGYERCCEREVGKVNFTGVVRNPTGPGVSEPTQTREGAT